MKTLDMVCVSAVLGLATWAGIEGLWFAFALDLFIAVALTGIFIVLNRVAAKSRRVNLTKESE